METSSKVFTMLNVQAWLESQPAKQFAIRKCPNMPRRYAHTTMVLAACKAFDVQFSKVSNDDNVHWIWDAAALAEKTFQKTEK